MAPRFPHPRQHDRSCMQERPSQPIAAPSPSAAAHDIIFSRPARDRGFFNYPYLEQLWSAHLNGRASHGVRFWSLLWLEMWFRMFVDRTMPLPTGGGPRSGATQEPVAMAVSRS